MNKDNASCEENGKAPVERLKIRVSDVTGDFDSFLSSFLLNVMTDHAEKRGEGGKNFLSIFKLEGPPGTDAPLEVATSVNGVEVDVKSFMRLLEESYDQMVNQRALRLVEERFAGLHRAVDKLESDAMRQAAELFGRTDRDGVYTPPRVDQASKFQTAMMELRKAYKEIDLLVQSLVFRAPSFDGDRDLAGKIGVAMANIRYAITEVAEPTT